MVLYQQIRDREEGEMNHGSKTLYFLNQKQRKLKF
jgi:hypothetical protein